MKIIKLDGLGGGYPEPIDGTGEWFACMMFPGWGCDMYEAEKIIQSGAEFAGSSCALAHYPDGRVYRPFALKKNVYVNKPVYDRGALYFLVVDFECSTIFIYSFSEDDGHVSKVLSLPRESVSDLYNLMLKTSPITLIRHGADDDFDVLYPEKASFRIGHSESMCFRDEDRFYFSEWLEDEDDSYHENVIVRDCNTGRIIEKFEGSMRLMPNGDVWVT